MKINMNTFKKLSATIALFSFVFFASANKSQVLAVYGSDVILGTTTPEQHVVVNAGLEDISNQLVLASVAFAGILSTTILFKKIK